MEQGSSGQQETESEEETSELDSEGFEESEEEEEEEQPAQPEQTGPQRSTHWAGDPRCTCAVCTRRLQRLV